MPKKKKKFHGLASEIYPCGGTGSFTFGTSCSSMALQYKIYIWLKQIPVYLDLSRFPCLFDCSSFLYKLKIFGVLMVNDPLDS